MERYMDTFKVEVQLESHPEYVPILNIEATFKLSEDGAEDIKIMLVSEAVSESTSPHDLLFTRHEIAQIRFAVADAIERRYWSGEYNTRTA